MANSVRTQGVDDRMLLSGAGVSVIDDATGLAFLPAGRSGRAGLVFICGSGIAADAYAPMLRPLAEEGFPIFVIKLPYRFAPLESHKRAAVDRARRVMSEQPGIQHWVVAGHSLGGALAARMARVDWGSLSGLALVGTTHPKRDDLSFLPIPVTKIYATNDGVAPPERMRANRGLLPPETTWVAIPGGNHSQFGRYGHQLLDGEATIGREDQEELTRAALRALLVKVGGAESRSGEGH